MTIDEWGAGELAAKVKDKHCAPLDLPDDVEIDEVAQKKNLYINSLDFSFNRLTYDPDKPLSAQGLDPSFTFKRPLDRLRVQFLDAEISPKHLIELAKFIRLHKNSIKSIEISVVDSTPQNLDARILKPLIEAIEETKDLHALVLNLNSSRFNWQHTNFESLRSLGNALRCLPKLEYLAVGVETNSFSRRSFDKLFDNLSCTPKLKSVVFDFQSSWGINRSDFCKYMADLQKLPRLEELTLYLGDNLNVNDKVIDVLCASLRNLPNLRMFSIDIDRTNCTIESFEEIATTVHSLQNVSFEISAMRDEIRLANRGAEDEAAPAEKEAGKEAAKAIEAASDPIDEIPDTVGELMATKRPVQDLNDPVKDLNDPVQDWSGPVGWIDSTGMRRKLARYPLDHWSNGVETSTRRRDQILFNRLA
ncbi:hypothetical protein [Pandoraea sputorum]|uniref:hypothetical protein n=1 Tax=Pandoraea sputorum TaxID=93222 RepID=UPI001CD66B19|nr:hypothetical protein [Pandoraea sputorum]